jgi:hypothetical protein
MALAARETPHASREQKQVGFHQPASSGRTTACSVRRIRVELLTRWYWHRKPVSGGHRRLDGAEGQPPANLPHHPHPLRLLWRERLQSLFLGGVWGGEASPRLLVLRIVVRPGALWAPHDNHLRAHVRGGEASPNPTKGTLT